MADASRGRGRGRERARGRGVDREGEGEGERHRDQRGLEIAALGRQIRDLERQLAEARVGSTAGEEGEESETRHSSEAGGDEEDSNPWGTPNQRRNQGFRQGDTQAHQNLGIKIDIPDFEGKYHPDEFIDWLHTVERVFDVKNLSEEQKVKLVAIKLRKHASLWWEHLTVRRVRERKPKIKTWGKMKKKLMAKFLPLQYKQEAFIEYHNFRQKTLTVEQYNHEFDLLRMRCDVSEEEEQVVARYLAGLRPEISDVVYLQQYYSYEDVCRLALKIESQQKRRAVGSRWQYRSSGGEADKRAPVTKPKPTSTPSHTQSPKTCPERGQDNRGAMTGRRCFKCQGLGHLMADCPNRQMITFVEEEVAPVYDDYEDGDPICDCIDGFEPKNLDGNWTSGGVKKSQLWCERNSSSLIEKDGFLEVDSAKLPDFANLLNDNGQIGDENPLSEDEEITHADSSGSGQHSTVSDANSAFSSLSSTCETYVPVLVRMLGLDNDHRDREQAVIALWKYSLGGKNYVDNIMKFRGCVNLIVNLVTSESSRSCETATGLLRMISSVNSYRDLVAESGAMEETTALLRRSSLSFEVKEQSLCMLWNLPTDEKLGQKIANPGLLPLVVRCLDDEDMKIVEAAGGVLANLALNPSNHKILVEVDVIPKLAKFLTCETEASNVIKKEARNALLELAKDNYYKILIMEEGLVLVPVLGSAAYASFKPALYSWPSLPDGTELRRNSTVSSRYGAAELLIGLNVEDNKITCLTMEVGQSSGSNSTAEIWAKLVPSDSNYNSIEISSSDTSICSHVSSTLDEFKWCQILRNPDLCSATIRNKRKEGILVDGALIQSEEKAGIKCGSEIVPASVREGHLSYKFEVMAVREEQSENKIQILVDSEHTKCSICLNVWHDVVTVAPCLHNFCNGCFSEWLRRCQEKHSSVLCPHCRGVVYFVGRNHFLHNIEEDILQADASLRRSKEELATLDSCASIKSSLVITNGKKNRRKRARSPVHEQNDDIALPPACAQCESEVAGFRCNESTVHLQCHSCAGMMPSRTDINIPQHCVGCDRAFCAAYWHAQGVSSSDRHLVCHLDSFKPISERRASIIPAVAHEGNQYERDITERCIRQTGKLLPDIVSEWVTKFNNRELDRTTLTLMHPDVITASTHVCIECYDNVVSFLLYWFRISLPSHLLPPEASNREDCWYGYACRTQRHSADHARKRNHVCRPTRGAPRP